MWHMGDGWGWWMAFGWLWMVVFWGLIIWAVYALVSRPGQRDTSQPAAPREATALEILEQRYARGELSHDEFEAMRDRLLQRRAATSASDGSRQ